jgi:hypothetical protein
MHKSMTPGKPGTRSNRWKIFSTEATKFSGRTLLRDAEPELYVEMCAELAGIVAYIDARSAALAEQRGADLAGIPTRYMPKPSERVPVEPPGARRLWRDEMRAGRRTMNTHDALWRAACCEENGLEAQRAGLHSSANYWFERAAQIINDAAGGK